MPTFSDTQDFGPYTAAQTDAAVVINAPGVGSVNILAVMADGTRIDIPGSPFAGGTSFNLAIANRTFRVQPNSGATYNWEDGS